MKVIRDLHTEARLLSGDPPLTHSLKKVQESYWFPTLGFGGLVPKFVVGALYEGVDVCLHLPGEASAAAHLPTYCSFID